MAGGRTNKKSCLTRCPVLCSSVLGVLLVLAVCVCVLVPLLYVYELEPAVEKEIDENVVLTPGSVGTSQFKSSSAPLYSAYYMFNITNAEDVEKGKMPKLVEIGPFVYKENRTKYNLTWEDNQNVLKYSMMINYTYDEALSEAQDPHKTMVTTINVPLIGVLSKMEALLNSAEGIEKVALEELLKLVDEAIKHVVSGEGLFVKKTVYELLWGYQDNLLSDLKEIQDDYNKIPGHKKVDFIDSTMFGFGNLSSVETPNRVYTGANETRLVGTFKQWNDHYSISGWGTKYAREIRGTGGFSFHPGVSRKEKLVAFINELYRSGYFSYEEDSQISGITLYKYQLPKEELLNTSQDPGFYANGPSGVLNLTAVVPSNVPLFVSKPHFLDADPAYLGNVSGLKPDRAKHDSYVSAEPITGAVLDAAKRIQVNLRLTRFSDLPQLSSLRDLTMLPVYWVAQTGTITPDLAAKFKSSVYTVEEGISGGVWGVTGLAAVVVVVCALCLVGLVMTNFKRGRSNVRRPPVAQDEHSPLLINPQTDI